MILPTIHLNGTHKDTLIEDYSKVGYALLIAETALIENGPNGRDYYPQGPVAFGQAALEHQKRVARLKDIRAEIEQIIYHIDRQP
jgi:hypothetical protein